MKKIKVEKDIKIAETLPANFYKNESIFEQAKDKILVLIGWPLNTLALELFC